ncbi:MAG TPA: alpha/beta fold hydrolase [Cyclobacteriaceae bacterium]|nr:alpha/beta fold hydrolase [Cyclobacteriaceae bacterium]
MLNYTPPLFLFNNHLETIYPSVFRSVEHLPRTSERIVTPDDDFLDLFWMKQSAEKVVIISHGLEGNAQRQYVRGMARAFWLNGFDVLTWNYRGCGTEMNRQLRFYHSGATDDLDVIVRHAATTGYKEIFLVGFSLGGNITLKYLGEQKRNPIISRAVAFSIPMDLRRSCEKISEPSNFIYSRRFLKSLQEKVIRKSKLIPGLDVTGIKEIKSLYAFDDRFTAPLHGFRNALHYYETCSSIHFIHHVSIPTLIVSARNDPFLSKECYPDLKGHPFVRTEYPDRGGHVGFSQFSKNGLYWSEERAVKFLTTPAS